MWRCSMHALRMPESQANGGASPQHVSRTRRDNVRRIALVSADRGKKLNKTGKEKKERKKPLDLIKHIHISIKSTAASLSPSVLMPRKKRKTQVRCARAPADRHHDGWASLLQCGPQRKTGPSANVPDCRFSDPANRVLDNLAATRVLCSSANTLKEAG